MHKEFDLERYLSNGVENIIKGAMRATLKNPRESLFLAKYGLASKKATKRRRLAKSQGENIPPFLIASITSSCNLHCTGCYARANHACLDEEAKEQLSALEWGRIFKEANELGIGFILLAGGEPMMRRDVLNEAAKYHDILFPVFTNGTMFDEDYLRLFDSNRNLVPVISIEGQKEKTNERRGKGVYDRIMSSMELLSKEQLAFGASVTLTKVNLYEVTGDDFLINLSSRGVKVVFYIEYVPVTKDTAYLAPTERERVWMEERLEVIRNEYEDMVFISFPGDEKSSGGCLAAGRGFFHINSHGGAEPCPFSPYSDSNVKDSSIREALHSGLFLRLQEENVMQEEHVGGCVLFERKDTVESLLGKDRKV